MNRFESVTGGTADKPTNPLMWFMALLLAVFVAGCSGGQGSILGLPAVNLVSVAVTSVPTPASVPILGIQQFTATATYSDGTSSDVTATAIWASSATGIASVVPTTGVATGIAAGTSQITATFGGQTSPAAALTVTAATLSTITVAPIAPTTTIGGTQTFVATGNYSDGTSANISSTVVWASSDITLATVVSTGVATGVKSRRTNDHCHLGRQVRFSHLDRDRSYIIDDHCRSACSHNCYRRQTNFCCNRQLLRRNQRQHQQHRGMGFVRHHTCDSRVARRCHWREKPAHQRSLPPWAASPARPP